MSIWNKYGMGYPDIRKMERKRDLEGLAKAINFQAVDQVEQRHIRREAIQALVRMGDARALEPIIDILHKDSGHSTVLVTAFQALGNIAARQANPAVFGKLAQSVPRSPLFAPNRHRIGQKAWRESCGCKHHSDSPSGSKRSV